MQGVSSKLIKVGFIIDHYKPKLAYRPASDLESEPGEELFFLFRDSQIWILGLFLLQKTKDELSYAFYVKKKKKKKNILKQRYCIYTHPL